MSTAHAQRPTTADVPPAAAVLDLTSAQLGIWNAQRLEPDSPYYVVGDVVEITGEEPPLSRAGLRAAPTRPGSGHDHRLSNTADKPL
ncbi:hypothetical protein AB0G02_41705, partial [Actinosynnema sp. NPDC023658]|uniref:hypothetical protein n=1 Tax=Actinosynnema sp. NPDC023658 TaxID=3155465 RepID=UPI0033F767BE